MPHTLYPAISLASLPGSDPPGPLNSFHFTLSSRARSASTHLLASMSLLPSTSFPFPLFPLSLPYCCLKCLIISPALSQTSYLHLSLISIFPIFHHFLPNSSLLFPLPLSSSTQPIPACFLLEPQFLLPLPAWESGLALVVPPPLPHAPSSRLLGFCPIAASPSFVLFKTHHPHVLTSFLLPALVNSSQRGMSLGLALEASRIVF